MRIGFTGTQKGMRKEQKKKFTLVLADLTSRQRTNEFLHGNCIGADEEAAVIAGNLGLFLVAFPCNLTSKQSTIGSHECRGVKAPLDRNRDIVDECDVLIICPYTFTDIVRSGTWFTYRYAESEGKRTITIFPDGEVIERKG